MKTKKLAVLFSGTGSNFAYILEHLHLKGFEVVVAICNRSDAKGIAFAKSYDIPLEIIESKGFTRREDFDTQLVETLGRYTPDLTILAGFMRILTPVFTEHIVSINLHPSLLPRHKGLHAIRKSYEDSYDLGGVTVHWVSSELDAGEIILQRSIQKQGMDLEAYTRTVGRIEKEVLIEAIQQIFEDNK
ncbi:MAG: formyltransferase family protein [Sulfurovum sp.]|nr:formyltransferase family protein [Sulfurovum sp.]